MPRKNHKLEKVVANFTGVDVMTSQGQALPKCRSDLLVGISEVDVFPLPPAGRRTKSDRAKPAFAG
jgi:hypothetical protein